MNIILLENRLNSDLSLALQVKCSVMSVNPLVTPCLLYCGSCRYFMTGNCRGCDSEDRQGCKILDCCRTEKKLCFCSECDDFPCPILKKSIGVHPSWLDKQAKLPLEK